MKVINRLTDLLFGAAADTNITRCMTEMAELGKEAARVLRESECRDIGRISSFERQSDSLEARIHEYIDGAMQLRFPEQRDVEHLSRELDDILDGMRRVVKHVEIYKQYFPHGSTPEEAKRLMDIISAMTEIVYTLVKKIETRDLSLPEINSLVDKLDRAESDADTVLAEIESALLARFAPDGNVFEYFALEKFYRLLEKITDSANHVGSLVLSIARK